MQFLKTIRLLKRLDYLIRNKATGGAESISRRLCISKRSTLRIIKELKDLGLPVHYSRTKQSYYYKNEVELEIKIKIGSKDLE